MTITILILALGLWLLWRALTAGSINSGTTITVNGTIPPQGTASSSTVPPLVTTVNSSATEVLGFGTSSGNCNLIVCQDRTLAASSNETLDLYGSTTPLLDIGGATCAFRHVKYVGIYVIPGTGDVNGLTIGGAGSDPWVGPLGGTSPTVTVYPNGAPFQVGEPTVGFAVTSGAGQLKIANGSSAASVSYRIVIGGTTT